MFEFVVAKCSVDLASMDLLRVTVVESHSDVTVKQLRFRIPPFG